MAVMRAACEGVSESLSVVSDSSRPRGLVHGILQAGILEWVAFPFSRGSSQPRDQTRPLALQAEPQGKPKNSGVGSPSLLHWIVTTL